jgi:epsilon-lactone hydrolase
MKDAVVLTPIETVIERIGAVYRRWGRATPVAQMRSDWDALFERELPQEFAGTQITAGSANGVPAQWIAAPGVRADKVVMYLHGGGFQAGSLVSHRELMIRLSAACGCRVLGVDYRLAPEHRFPAPLQDALVACEWLRAQGFEDTDVALAGDSAGGGLALSLLLSLRDAGRAMPAAAVLMSPWTDLSASGESYVTRAAQDPIHQRPMIVAMARNYLGKDPSGNDRDPRDPLASPLFADLQGLPSLLIQVGERETVLSDSTEFAKKAQAAGVPVKLVVWPDMIHVFQQFAGELPEARAAIASSAKFLQEKLQVA